MFMLYNSKEFNLIGNTVDDAAGEAFDKGAKILGLGYPGGILIDKLSKNVKKDFYKFPIAKMGKNSLNFSFSGLKTSLKYYLDKNKDWEKNLNQIAASYQEAIVDSLLENLLKAIENNWTKDNISKLANYSILDKWYFEEKEKQLSFGLNNNLKLL